MGEKETNAQKGGWHLPWASVYEDGLQNSRHLNKHIYSEANTFLLNEKCQIEFVSDFSLCSGIRDKASS